MEPLEFLGGKYQQPEQIVPGEVQTFRARESATGRVVFVHRVSAGSADQRQAALLRLLLTGLFRSSSARSQILDFGEEPGFWYVVTESTEKCLLLREWLQLEIGSALPGNGAQLSKPEDDSDTHPKAESPSPTKQKADLSGGPIPFVIREQPVQRPAPSNPPPAPPRVEYAKPEPVPAKPTLQPTMEHQWQSQWQSQPEPKSERNPEPEPIPAPVKQEPVRVEPRQEVKPEPPKPSPSQGEPGEFTRFFQGGLPPSAPGRPDAFRSQDRPSRGFGPVQRPSNPPSTPPKTEPGEFTRMFNRTSGESTGSTPPPSPAPKPAIDMPSGRGGYQDNSDYGFNNPSNNPRMDRLPDLSNRPSDLPNMFQANAEAPTPMRTAAQEPGEYTRMFGKGSVPPPIQSQSAVGPMPTSRSDDPLGGSTRVGMPAPQAPPPPPPPSGPSEFTRVMMGTRAQEPQAGQGTPAAGGPGPEAAPGMAPPAGFGKPPAMPGQIPGMGGGHGAPAGGPAPHTGPMGPGPMNPGGGAPMGGGGMGNVQVMPINPMYAAGGAGVGRGFGTDIPGVGMAHVGMGNPMMGQMGNAGIMTPMGSANASGPNMHQNTGQPGAQAGHPAAAPGMPGQFKPGALPKAPDTGMGSKGKLLILFGVLAVLAIAMVLFVIFASHK